MPTSLRLVLHSFQLLFRNIVEALKVSLAPLGIAVAVAIAALSVSGVSPEILGQIAATGQMPPMVALVLLFVAVVIAFTLAWIAVAWHRFVLLEEYPGVIPALTGRPIWPYVWRTLGLGVLIFALTTALSLVVGAVLSLSPALRTPVVSNLVAFGVGTILTFVWLRIALVLPAIAVGESLGLREAWTLSAQQARVILGVAAIFVALSLVAGALQQSLFGGSVLGGVLNAVVNWITLMVGTSVLTTLYGHFVQKRPLP